MSEYKSIVKWAVDDRPREKLLQHGSSVLSTAELLAILLGSGSREESAVDLAKRILAYYDNKISRLSKATPQELCKNFKGIGYAKAVTILASMELGARKRLENEERITIRGSEDIFRHFLPRLGDLTHEEFWVTMLNNANVVIATRKLSMGGTKGTVVDNVLLMKMAIEYLASGIIICHNHPSGTLQASDADIKITQKINSLCELLDIRLLDHLIVCGKTYFSFADEGML